MDMLAYWTFFVISFFGWMVIRHLRILHERTEVIKTVQYASVRQIPEPKTKQLPPKNYKPYGWMGEQEESVWDVTEN